MDSSSSAAITSFTNRYVPAKDPVQQKPAAQMLTKKVSKLEDDVRNKRCDDIIQNDKTAVTRAAAVPGATAGQPGRVDTYA